MPSPPRQGREKILTPPNNLLATTIDCSAFGAHGGGGTVQGKTHCSHNTNMTKAVVYCRFVTFPTVPRNFFRSPLTKKKKKDWLWRMLQNINQLDANENISAAVKRPSCTIRQRNASQPSTPVEVGMHEKGTAGVPRTHLQIRGELLRLPKNNHRALHRHRH